MRIFFGDGMNRFIKWVGLACFVSNVAIANDEPPPYYSKGLCQTSGYHCIKTESGDTWQKLFPDDNLRDIVQRINRTYNPLWAGKVLAVPDETANLNFLDFSPFDRHMDVKEKTIVVDQDKLAWGAFDAKGNLINWGPIASGSNKCSDSNNRCLTMTGVFRVFSKENENCKSDIFPLNKGGAKMPYCMFFHKGFALHGSDDIPGYRASHGCVRMFVQDAKWLNEHFVETSTDKNTYKGTLVVMKPVQEFK
jgi:hypothetical protein